VRWTTRLRRFGGANAIAMARARQLRWLNQAATKRVDLKQTAEGARVWLLENPLRRFSVAEEQAWKEAVS